MKRIGILGGTFDQPHLGHLHIAEETRIHLNLDEIWFMPSYRPPHKENAKSSTKDRLNMVEKAIGDNEYFAVQEVELNCPGKSYTVDTMYMLNEQFPHTQFYFIIGADMVEFLPNWDRIDDLIKLVTFVGVSRTHYRLDSDYPIIPLNIPLFDISSSQIRKRCKNKESIKYLVTDNVREYVEENKLYEY